MEKYQGEFQKTAKDYIKKNVDELKITNPAKAASILKRLGGAPGDCGDESGFTLLSHQEKNLTPSECTGEKKLQYFTNISKEFAALDVSVLPPRVKVELLDQYKNIPNIEDYMVYNAIKKAKKPRLAGVPGNLPKKLVQEFPVELATPVAKVLRSVMKSNKWPSKWSGEHGLALSLSSGQAHAAQTTYAATY